MARVLLLLTLVAVRAAAQTVEGSVFDAATGAGAGGVKVELLKGGTPFYETTTDGGGRFRFDGVREGDFAVRYQSPGYWLTAGPSDYRTFHVGGGDPVKLEARLMPWSKISGRVVDGRGQGVANAELTLTGPGMVMNGRTYLRTSWGEGGGGQLSAAPLAMTYRGNADARGRFEVKVMPGAYGLSVAPPVGMKPPAKEPDGPALVWVRTYYPGTALAEDASKLAVPPGADVMDLEIKLLALPARAIRGTVAYPDGSAAPKVAISLGEAFRVVSVESNADGRFEFPAVAEGGWRLLAQTKRGGVALRATEWIEVPRHDLEDVKLRLAAPLAVRGRVVVEGAKDAPPPEARPLMLFLRGGRDDGEFNLEPGGVALVVPGPNGEFTLQDAYPGVYRLAPQLQPPAPPYYLEAVRLGGVDVAAQDVELTTDGEMTVVYRADGGRVSGTAEGCASGGVLLVPRDAARRRGDPGRSGPCDARGHYEVRGVRPGDYDALAFAGNGPVPVVDEALLNGAVKVTVRAGEGSVADLRAITRPVY